jgi:hypothetical protein
MHAQRLRVPFPLLATACFLLAASPTLVAQPSPTPNCYVCPEADVAFYALTTSNYASNPIVCYYGEPFGCSYDSVSKQTFFFTAANRCLHPIKVTGAIEEDFNEGLCPVTAKFDCAARAGSSRRNTIPRSPRAASPAASEAKPDTMHVRARLGGRRRIQKDRD